MAGSLRDRGAARTTRSLLDEASSLFRAGEVRSSASVALQAAEVARPAGRWDLVAEAALIPVGVPDPAVAAAVERMAEEALAGLGADDVARRARLHGQLAVALHHRERFEEAADHVAEALELADRSGDPTALATALHAQGLTTAGGATAAQLLDIGGRMLDAAIACGDSDLELMARSWRTDALIRSGETAQAGHEIDALAVIATRSGRPLGSWYTHLARAGLAHAIGRFADAETEAGIARDVLPPSQRPHTEPLFVAQTMLIATDRCAAPDDLEIARTHAIGLPLIAVAMTGRFDLEMGDMTRAQAALEAVKPRLDSVALDRRGLPTLAAAIELATAFHDGDLAADLSARMQPFDGSMIASSLGAVGPVAYFIARAEKGLGRHDAAIAHLEAAIALSGRGGFAPWVARSRLAHAEALLVRGGPGDVDLARRSAQLAAAGGDQLGMARVLAGAQTVLATMDGRERLTPRELEVATLVAQGSTNRDIAAELTLSERTVETHVQNILGKLAFHSRSEIAAWVARAEIEKQSST